MTAYIEEAPPKRQEALIRLRELCLATLTGYDEAIEYGGPTYPRNGVVEAGFAS